MGLMAILSTLSALGSAFVVASYLQFTHAFRRIGGGKGTGGGPGAGSSFALVAHAAAANFAMESCLLWHYVTRRGRAQMAEEEIEEILATLAAPLCSASDTLLHYFAASYALFNCLLSWSLYERIAKSRSSGCCGEAAAFGGSGSIRVTAAATAPLWRRVAAGWGLPLAFVLIPGIFSESFGRVARRRRDGEEVLIRHGCDDIVLWAATTEGSEEGTTSPPWRVEAFLFLPSFLAVAFILCTLVLTQMELSRAKRAVFLQKMFGTTDTKRKEANRTDRESLSAVSFTPIEKIAMMTRANGEPRGGNTTTLPQNESAAVPPPMERKDRYRGMAWMFLRGLRCRMRRPSNSDSTPLRQVDFHPVEPNANAQTPIDASDGGHHRSFISQSAVDPRGNRRSQRINNIMGLPSIASFGTFLSPSRADPALCSIYSSSPGQITTFTSVHSDHEDEERVSVDIALMRAVALHPATFVLCWAMGGTTMVLTEAIVASSVGKNGSRGEAAASLFHLANLGMASAGVLHALALLRTQPHLLSRWRGLIGRKGKYDESLMMQDENYYVSSGIGEQRTMFRGIDEQWWTEENDEAELLLTQQHNERQNKASWSKDLA